MLRYTLLQLAQKINASDIDNMPTLSADDVLVNVLNIFHLIVGIVAVVVIIVGGLRYTASAGNPDGVKAGKNLILYGIVGLVVIMASFAIVNFVTGAL